MRSILGEGGMGTVYRVSDQLDGGAEVALKTIKSAGPVTLEQRLRFKDEFRAMARLKHPNTITVLDFGLLDANSLYITMELVPGRELADVIDGRQVPLAEVYPLLVQLLRALDFIHARGFVHRDIKAANVRVRDDGVLKLMDFGLMGQLGQPSTRTVTGSPGYLAPEVAVGGAIDASSDLYAVGCLAYEMVTGRLPFSGSLIEVVRHHVGTKPQPPRELRPDLPERLERLILKLMEKEQTRRYRNAAAVLEDLSALAGVSATAERDDQRSSYLAAPALIGRDAELAVLTAALKSATHGMSRAVVIGAPAGAGKSRLVQELVLAAKLSYAHVLYASAEEGSAAPYETLARALKPALGDAAKVPEAVAATLYGNSPAAPGVVAEGVVAWLRELANNRPMVLVLDDMHWSDARSIEVFNHCARHVGAHGVLCVGTHRNDETAPDSPVWYTVEDGSSAGVNLGPLTPDAQLELIQAMLPGANIEAGFAAALYGATGGNAFFLGEVLRSLMEDGALARRDGGWAFPTDPGALAALGSIEATVARRLDHLDPAARELAGVAAVLGRHQPLPLLLGMTGLEEDDLFGRLDQLLERQLIEKGAAGYTFPHDRVREVCYARLEPARREALHQRAGELLEAGGAADVYELAWHYGHAGDPARAYRYLRAAGDAARAAGSPAMAIDFWARADEALGPLEQGPDRQALWWQIGATGFEIRPDLARTALERLIGALDAVDPRAVEARAFLATALGFGGHPVPGLVAAQDALARVPADQPLRQAAALMVQGPALLAAGHIDALIDVAARARAVLAPIDPTGHGPFVLSTRVGAISYALAVCHQGLRPPAGALEHALEAAEDAGALNLYLTIRHYPALAAAARGEQAEVQAYLDWGAAFCRKTGAPPHPWLLYMRAQLAWQRGELDAALVQVDKALALPYVRLSAPAVQYTQALRGQVLLDRGDLDGAAAAFGVLEAEAREQGLVRALARAAIGRGDVALARQVADAA
ncbi:MAG: pknB11, partial [Cyanobacteria bacterium RYN_339]|nr:pknB11 [Cyanobacteria bacterium RYN_339]